MTIRNALSLSILLVYAAALPFSSVSNASEQSKQTNPILAVIDFYPFGYWSESIDSEGKKAKGMVFDIAEVIEKYSGITIDARLMSTPRALRSASVGQNDLLFSYKDDVMVPNVTWLGNVGCLVPLIVPRIDSGISTLNDLNKDKSIGFVRLGYFDVSRKERLHIKPVPLNDNFLMVKMLIRKRIDAIVINNAVLNAFLSNPDIIEDLPKQWSLELSNPIPLTQFETHISMSNDSPFFHLVPQLKEAIIAARSDQQFDRIFKKYGSIRGGHCYSQKEIDENIWLPH